MGHDCYWCCVCLCVSTVTWHVVCLHVSEKCLKSFDSHPKVLVPLVFGPCAVLTSEVAVVGWYHQQLSLGVLDNVTPMDGVRMAQEFVLVNINPTVQYLCTGREKTGQERRGVST